MDVISFAPAPISSTPKGAGWFWAWALAIPSSSEQVDAEWAVTFLPTRCRSLQTPAGWIQFASTHGLKIEEVLIRQLVEVGGRWVFRSPIPSSGVRSVRTNDLSVVHFADKLRSSHVIAVLPPGDGIGKKYIRAKRVFPDFVTALGFRASLQNC